MEPNFFDTETELQTAGLRSKHLYEAWWLREQMYQLMMKFYADNAPLREQERVTTEPEYVVEVKT